MKKSPIKIWCYHHVELKRELLQRAVPCDYEAKQLYSRLAHPTPTEAVARLTQLTKEDCGTDLSTRMLLDVTCVDDIKICMFIGLVIDDVTSDINKTTNSGEFNNVCTDYTSIKDCGSLLAQFIFELFNL